MIHTAATAAQARSVGAQHMQIWSARHPLLPLLPLHLYYSRLLPQALRFLEAVGVWVGVWGRVKVCVRARSVWAAAHKASRPVVV